METTYLVCALIGGTLIVVQFVMTLIGLGGDHDMGGDHDVSGDHGMDGSHDVSTDADHADGNNESFGHASTNWLFGVLTFRTITAGLAFFGLTGLALQSTNLSQEIQIVAALGTGLLAIFIVSWIMRSLSRLNVDGTIRIEKALGASGTVYLSIPGGKAGAGKVNVQVMGRFVEYRAVTSSVAIPTGSNIVVVGVLNNNTVEVNLAESREEVSQS